MEILKSLTSFYSIEKDITWAHVETQHMNDSWIGLVNGQKKYVLRKYCRTNNVEEILAEHTLLFEFSNHLNDLIVCPYETTNKETYLLFDHHVFALFPFINGETLIRGNKNQIPMVAHTLAQVHNAGFELQTKLPHFKNKRPPLNSKLIEDRLDYFKRSSSNKELAEIDHDFLTRIGDQVIHSLDNELSNLTYFPIHADFNHGNILFDQNEKRITAVLDWEESRWDSPLYDLAGASQMFCQNLFSTDLSGEFIPEYLKTLNNDLQEEMRSLIIHLPKARQAVWLNEFFVVTAEMKPPRSYLMLLLRWVQLK